MNQTDDEETPVESAVDGSGPADTKPTSTGPARRRRPWPLRRTASTLQERLPWRVIAAASVAGALSIAILGLAGDIVGAPILIAAFGSSCVLVFLMPEAPLSQPVNVVGGHVVSALCGLVVHTLLPVSSWSLGLAVGAAMAAMAALRVIHPPAGGTPIAIMVTDQPWSYLVVPVLVGAVLLCACALAYRALRRGASAAPGSS